MYDKVETGPASGGPPLSPDEAAATLAAIHRYMGRAAEFSGYSAGAGVAAGVASLAAAAFLFARHGLAVPPALEFALVWGGVAVLALAVAAVATLRKARARNEPVWNGPTRLVVTALAAPFAATAVLTFSLGWRGHAGLLPGVWLILYGTGLWAAALSTRREFQLVGAGALALGTAALCTKVRYGTLWMGLGFGGLHLVYAAIAARLRSRDGA